VGSERIFSRVLDYLATRPDVDSKHIVAWGVSYGGPALCKPGAPTNARRS